MHIGGCFRSLLHEYPGEHGYWCSLIWQKELSSEGLEGWLCSHIVTYFREQGGCDVTNFVITNSREADHSVRSLNHSCMSWGCCCQLYIRRVASLKSRLHNWKPCVPMGRTDSHDEALFLAKSA